RIGRGQLALQKQPVDLAQVLARAVETVRPLIDARRHELSLSLPPAPLPLEADPTRLEQIVSNLLKNAAEYTEPGGRLWLSARREGDEAVLRVRDSGAGIPPEVLPHLFDPFTRPPGSRERSHAGLGIGLLLVQRLVEMHGGSASASSGGPGQGSE